MGPKNKSSIPDDNQLSSDDVEMVSPIHDPYIGLPSEQFRKQQHTRIEWETHSNIILKGALEPWDNKKGKQFDGTEKVEIFEAAFQAFPGIYEYTKNPSGGFQVMRDMNVNYTNDAEKNFIAEHIKSIQNSIVKAIISRILFKAKAPETLEEMIDYYEKLCKKVAPELLFSYFERLVSHYLSVDEPKLTAPTTLMNRLRSPGQLILNESIARFCSHLNSGIVTQFQMFYKYKAIAMRYCGYIVGQMNDVRNGKPFDYDRLTNEIDLDPVIEQTVTERHKEEIARIKSNNSVQNSVNSMYNTHQNNNNSNYYNNNDKNNKNNKNYKNNKNKNNKNNYNKKGKVSKVSNETSDYEKLKRDLVRMMDDLRKEKE
ncbi:putative retrotransposon protein [Candida dubliniensis CD36]|uniref:Retrotransposon protein n=2 Tax=Candida dubliniensis (strain CD36 / ATCC MYA-646 / CBS 7987 / NCPF 3949 / NRRL Y-17841) TaxID=573826 RepID=B9WDF7_CANDC|nr:putative retrotransposon protein [Candida dubliniensis CD36]CAX42710.1 putative retrotransposon protein [Candida dubliniensis CD36]